MKKEKIDDIKRGDFILLTTRSKLTFAGIVENIEEKSGKRLIIFRPSKDSPLWITIEEGFIERLKMLIPSEEIVK